MIERFHVAKIVGLHVWEINDRINYWRVSLHIRESKAIARCAKLNAEGDAWMQWFKGQQGAVFAGKVAK